jgi:ferredoxin-type protein NapF
MAGPADPSRRAFLTGRSAGSGPVPRLGIAPPWLDGRITAEVCRDCASPCVDACPERIVAIHPAQHPAEGLAYIDFGIGACTFCRACVEVCPEGPTDLTGIRPLPPVSLDESRCLAAQGVVCVICVARCPERALSGEPGGRINLSIQACTGCGACISACPTEALSI